jgi:hypothetical protein
MKSSSLKFIFQGVMIKKIGLKSWTVNHKQSLFRNLEMIWLKLKRLEKRKKSKPIKKFKVSKSKLSWKNNKEAIDLKFSNQISTKSKRTENKSWAKRIKDFCLWETSQPHHSWIETCPMLHSTRTHLGVPRMVN